MGNLTNFRILLEQLSPKYVTYFILSDVKIYPDSVKMDSEKWWVVTTGKGESMTDAVALAEYVLNRVKGEN